MYALCTHEVTFVCIPIGRDLGYSIGEDGRAQGPPTPRKLFKAFNSETDLEHPLFFSILLRPVILSFVLFRVLLLLLLLVEEIDRGRFCCGGRFYFGPEPGFLVCSLILLLLPAFVFYQTA